MKKDRKVPTAREWRVLEVIVRAAVKSVTAPPISDKVVVKYPIFVNGTFMDLARVRGDPDDIPVPLFAKMMKPKPGSLEEDQAKLFDGLLWHALRQGEGDPDKVWKVFRWGVEGMRVVGIGINQVEKTRAGHAKVHGTSEQKLKYRAQYQTTIDELRKSAPDQDFQVILERAAKKLKRPKGEPIAPRTLRRYVKDPREKK